MRILAGICAALAIGLLLALWRIDHVSTSLDMAEGTISSQLDTITTLEVAAQSRRNTQRLLADLDTQHTQELTNAQATNNLLRAAVATGARRLSVIARCPAVRAATATTGVDDAEARADIDPASAQDLVAITNDGDEAIIALSALQDYVTSVCIPRK